MSIPVEEIPALRMELFNYMGAVEKSYADKNIVNLDLARQIAQRASMLLDKYPEFPEKERALIIAGVKYFCSDGDGVSDFDFASGLNDDAQVMNHVLEEIGIKDHFIVFDR